MDKRQVNSECNTSGGSEEVKLTEEEYTDLCRKVKSNMARSQGDKEKKMPQKGSCKKASKKARPTGVYGEVAQRRGQEPVKLPQRNNGGSNPPLSTKPSKYKNKKVVVQGIIFDSQKEGYRYLELLSLEKAGIITNLERQVKYPFEVNNVKIGYYLADFAYKEGDKTYVEDVKSEFTRKLPVYRLKKKLMLACHGIEIKEVK